MTTTVADELSPEKRAEAVEALQAIASKIDELDEQFSALSRVLGVEVDAQRETVEVKKSGLEGLLA
ncbi:MAG: hypothetical protein MSC31_10855 [Solirubrobacteraceae bacterium MAG38_C4-C5]|nr:hypothetical protein [Candidatus Siliceabacter maunaloa]